MAEQLPPGRPSSGLGSSPKGTPDRTELLDGIAAGLDEVLSNIEDCSVPTLLEVAKLVDQAALLVTNQRRSTALAVSRAAESESPGRPPRKRQHVDDMESEGDGESEGAGVSQEGCQGSEGCTPESHHSGETGGSDGEVEADAAAEPAG